MSNINRLKEINNAIHDILEQIQQSKIINSQIRNTREALSGLKEKLKILEVELKKEEKDVEKLQTISFENLLHSIINDKSEKISKEEYEVLEVKAKIDSLKYEIGATENRLESLQKQAKVASSLEEKYNDLMAKKRAFIETELPQKWHEISKRTEQIEGLLLEQKELKEAISAGKATLFSVDAIQTSLNSAAGWGTFDILGGGMISTMIKRDHMRQAQDQIHNLKYKLNSFNQELKDVDDYLDINLGIGDFLGFADWFFDGLFVDIAVQSKINSAREQFSDLKRKIDEILKHLNNEENLTQSQIAKLKQENDKSLETI